MVRSKLHKLENTQAIKGERVTHDHDIGASLLLLS